MDPGAHKACGFELRLPAHKPAVAKLADAPGRAERPNRFFPFVAVRKPRSVANARGNYIET